ncbi:hypothetical protein Kpho01_67330 [Kitasatospora phosalacinea]|uniref:Glycosyl transferase family 28 C-terminal domain-containing protein n=1 Tax=Kitasatospora phosalacinea TaxID=2065 RepID=A0A9W6UT24_9ACTN|nr:hypothetical protein Kpho01_67330 [Kitasatospora phosalacinea]
MIHQCGPANEATLRGATDAMPLHLAARYLLTGYTGAELPDVLALADVVVSRSGAGTLAELTALGKAAVFVPLPTSAGNEQAHNAVHLQDAGAAVALTGDVTADVLREALVPLLADSARRSAMAACSREHGHPYAAQRLVDLVLDAAGLISRPGP